jgi:cobalt/nickel transport system ATP-binding protein
MTADTHIHTPEFADEVVRVSCVRHRYEDGASVFLCGLDFVARAGQRVALLGPNGAGKTTMLFHILGLLKAEEGLVRVFGEDPAQEWAKIRKRVGVVLQNVDEQLIMPTVADDVAFTPRQLGLDRQEVEARVAQALARMGIADLADRVPHALSGGEKRKVALAGAIATEPELLVLDEPFEGLDPASRDQIVGLLGELAAAGTTIVLTTHDIDTVPEFADYCYVMQTGGAIALRGTPAEIFSHAEQLAESNIRPPVLAELFAELKERDVDAPGPALSIAAAADALVAWRGSARD